MFGSNKTTAPKTEEKRTPIEVFADLPVRGHFKLNFPDLESACLQAMNDEYIARYVDFTVVVDDVPLWMCYPIESLPAKEWSNLMGCQGRFLLGVSYTAKDTLIEYVKVNGISPGVAALLTKTLDSAQPVKNGGVSITFTKRGSDQTAEVTGWGLVDLLERAETSVVWYEGKEFPLAGWNSPELGTLREVVRLIKEADEKGIPRGMYRY